MILSYPNIIPECFIDTNLIEYLVHGTVNHQQGCNKVIGTLNGTFKDRFAIGIIDKDKVEVGYLLDCSVAVTTEHLCIWKHNRLPHFLITVKPAIDRFLLDCAKEQGVKPESFGIPSQLKAFTKRSKKSTSNRNPAFRKLIEAIHNNPEIVFFKCILNYLRENQYNARVEVIQSMII